MTLWMVTGVVARLVETPLRQCTVLRTVDSKRCLSETVRWRMGVPDT